MVYLTKKEADKIAKELSKSQDEEIKAIVKKLSSPKKRAVYVHDKAGIMRLLKRAFKEKRKVKMSYYSLSSDGVRTRIVDIYQIYNGCIIAFCHLREEERTFVIDRINSAAILDEKYKIPKDWSPESIILDK
jgi:predicted DNA-binding transcriptional regulator YafY